MPDCHKRGFKLEPIVYAEIRGDIRNSKSWNVMKSSGASRAATSANSVPVNYLYPRQKALMKGSLFVRSGLNLLV